MNKLREAAQAVAKAYDDGECWFEDAAIVDALRDALAEDRLDEMQRLTELDYGEWEYELWGRVTGGHGSGRIWPVGTTLYVRVEKKT